jgi:serine/threonine protein kinase/tetratricopeptide (TPR) repeat protein
MVPTTEDRFDIRDEIGRGAHGRVVKAWDRQAGEWVAIKELSATTGASELPLFKQEFRLAREIRHDNLVRLYELFVTAQSASFSMELLHGRSLAEMLQDRSPLDVASIFGQLADGLQFLHSHGIVHRDVKPTNVFCAEGNRVVLLDYGLAVSLTPQPTYAADDSIAGTFTYMAPEVLFGRPPGPASDWYSFGAVLAEYVLDGRPLFPDTPDEFVQAKLQQIPEALWVGVRREYPGLANLCQGLLHPDPLQRPSYEHVCDVLGRPPKSLMGLDHPSPFVGRESELAALESAWTRAGGQLYAVFLHGPPGIGKSKLANVFIERLPPSRDRIVLRSKCDPQEAVHFNALDWIDQLAGLLDELDDAQRRLTLPVRSAALGRLFPALARHCELDAETDDVSPDKIKRDAASQLGFLLTQLSRLRRMLIWFDDVQWADRDSFQFLREVVRRVGGGHLLILITSREAPEKGGEFEELLRQIGAERMELPPLGEEDVRTLMRAAETSLQDEDLEWLLSSARGVPFFVNETLRLNRRHAEARSERFSVKDRLRQTIAELPNDLQDILNLVVLSEVTPSMGDLQTLVRSDHAARFAVFELCHRHLLKTSAAQQDYAVEVYHDLWREIIADLIDDDQRAAYHRRFIDFFENQDTENALALHRHYLAVGDRAAASRHALDAGKVAMRDLAFSQAVELFRSALELGVDDVDRWRVTEQLANALAFDGRVEEATAAFEAAAAMCPDGSAGFDGIRLMYQAASQCLWSGDRARGIALLTRIAPGIGIDIPATPQIARRRATLQRLRSWRVHESATLGHAEPDPLTRLKLSVLEDVTLNMSIIDHKKAEALSVEFLRLACDQGRPADMIHAFCIEAANEANVGGGGTLGRALRRRARELVDKADSIAEGSTPYDRAHVLCMRCCVSLFLGDYQTSRESGQKGMKYFQERPLMQSWRIGPTVTYLAMALYYLGDLPALRALVARDVKRSGPLAALGQGFGSAFLLQVDAATAGAAEALDAVESHLPRNRFTSGHWGVWMMKTNLLLYEGRHADAWRYIESTWPSLRRELFLELDWIAVAVRFQRSLCALHVLHQDPGDAGARRAIREDLRMLGRSGMPSAPAYAASLRGGLARLEGDKDSMEQQFAAAADGFNSCNMHLMCELARWRREMVLGSEPAPPSIETDDQGTFMSERNFIALADAYLP